MKDKLTLIERLQAPCPNCPHPKPATQRLSQREYDIAIHTIAWGYRDYVGKEL